MIPGQKLLYTAFVILLVSSIACAQSTSVSVADGVVAEAESVVHDNKDEGPHTESLK